MANVEYECANCDEWDKVDVDVHDFFDACSDSEVLDLIDALVANGYINRGSINTTNLNASEAFYEEALNKLHGKWNRLTKEEEQIIILLGSKF